MRKENFYGNKLMQSSYKIMKRRLIGDVQFRDIHQAQIEIFKYIFKLTIIPNECTLLIAINLLELLKRIPLMLLAKCLVFLTTLTSLLHKRLTFWDHYMYTEFFMVIVIGQLQF